MLPSPMCVDLPRVSKRPLHDVSRFTSSQPFTGVCSPRRPIKAMQEAGRTIEYQTPRRVTSL